MISAQLLEGRQTDAEAFRDFLLGKTEVLTELLNGHAPRTSHGELKICTSYLVNPSNSLDDSWESTMQLIKTHAVLGCNDLL